MVSTKYCLGKSFARNSKPYKNKFAFFASFEKVVSLQSNYKKLQTINCFKCAERWGTTEKTASRCGRRVL